MTNPLQPSVEKKDQGFTLVELLVVIVIIGILAGIAIPLFLSQREKAAEASLKSDLKNAATVMETQYVDTQTYVLAVAPTFTKDPDNTLTISAADTTSSAFCIDGTSTGTTALWSYDSDAGGLVSGAC